MATVKTRVKILLMVLLSARTRERVAYKRRAYRISLMRGILVCPATQRLSTHPVRPMLLRQLIC